MCILIVYSTGTDTSAATTSSFSISLISVISLFVVIATSPFGVPPRAELLKNISNIDMTRVRSTSRSMLETSEGFDERGIRLNTMGAMNNSNISNQQYNTGTSPLQPFTPLRRPSHLSPLGVLFVFLVFFI